VDKEREEAVAKEEEKEKVWGKGSLIRVTTNPPVEGAIAVIEEVAEEDIPVAATAAAAATAVATTMRTWASVTSRTHWT
jgi:beta-phosphoglucomutase-like phosphatase (HAD superfamily)